MKRTQRFHNKPPRRRATKKQLAIRKRWQHILVYSLLAVAIVAVRILIPGAAATAYGEVKGIFQWLGSEAQDLSTYALALIGLAYTLKELWNILSR